MTRALPADRSQLEDPKVIGAEEDFEAKPYISLTEAIEGFVNELVNAGYKMVPAIGGEYCGYKAFKQVTDINTKLPGLKAPDSFWYWREISGEEEERAFTYAVINIGTRLINGVDNKSEEDILRSITKAFEGNRADPRSIVARNTISKVPHTAPLERTITGQNGAYKVVPPIEWFPEQVQKVNVKDLLTLFPEAELDQFMLILGKAMVGNDQTKTKEGFIKHTAREYAIVIGKEAGLGKSTMFKYFMSAWKVLGYAVDEIPIDETKFGWGRVATADIAYLDDLISEDQGKFMKDNKVKPIASGGTLKVEEKGVQSVNVRATSTLFACSNSYDPGHFIRMDAGSISRVNQLDTYSSDELKALYPDKTGGKIPDVWKAKAKTLDVSIETLAAYVLRRSADRFLEVSGHTVTNNILTKHDELDRLLLTSTANRERFRLPTGLRHVDELIDVAGCLVAWTISKTQKTRDRDKMIENLEYANFTGSLLFIIISLFATTTSSDVFPDELKGLELTQVDLECRKSLKHKLADLERLSQIKANSDVFSTLIKELTSNMQFGYPQSGSHYYSPWATKKRQIPFIIDRFDMVSIDLEPDVLAKARNRMENHLLSF